jgi:hypothetical protein
MNDRSPLKAEALAKAVRTFLEVHEHYEFDPDYRWPVNGVVLHGQPRSDCETCADVARLVKALNEFDA